MRKRDGSVLTYQYDALNRMTAKVVPERAWLTAAQTRDVHYGYDLRNLQLFARFDSPTGEGITNIYDGFGRLTSSSTNMGGAARTLSYQYDAAGNRTRITHPDLSYFTATYDALGRQTWIHEQGIFGRVVAGYNAWGSLAGTSRSNGTLTNYGYDAVQRPNAYYHDLGGTAADGLWLFARNPAGQIASHTRENDAYAWTRHYAVNRVYTANGLNQYSETRLAGAPAGTPLTYDANGNLISDGASTFTYDIENRLVGRSGGVMLAYDPLGRLFSVSSPTTATQFLYEGDALVAEYNGAGVMTRRYVHWTGADVPMLSYADAVLTQLSQLHADERGSIIAATDANGAATINAYDDYGIPGVTNSGRFQYTGQAWLPELGMYHYKARVYSPSLGRFLQVDPIGYDDQFNLYAYVGNDPVNAVDPDGRCQTRDSAKECVVTNRAGPAGVGATNTLQTQVRQVDHAIRNLDPKERVKVDTGGGNHQVMSGTQIARAWANTDWAIDPETTTYANGLGAQMDNGRFSGRPSYVESFRNRARDWGRDQDEATRSVVLHDFGHSTRAGQAIMGAHPGSSTADFNLRERATSRLGESIGNAIGVTFECRTFGLGC